MTPTKSGHGNGQSALDRHHAQHGHADHDGLYNEDVAHEYSDVEVRPLLIASIGLVAVVAVVALAMAGMFRVLENQAAKNDPVISPVAYPAGRERPEPKLLEDEPGYLRTVKTGERQVLEGYAWIDQQAGTVRIPIDEAKKRLLEQGLPVRTDAAVEPWMGTRAAARGEASGGRAIPLRPGMTVAQPPAPSAAPPVPPKSGGH